MAGAADSVPMALLSNPRVAPLLAQASGTHPDVVSDNEDDEPNIVDGIVQVAHQHKAGASTHRLVKPKVLTQGTSGALKNLQKKQDIVAERKAKKEEDALAKTGVRISGQLFLMIPGKMNPVRRSPFVVAFMGDD